MANIVLSQDQKQAVEMVRVLFPHLKEVSDVEVAKAIATAKYLGLDPVRREVHLVPFKNSVQLVVSYLEYVKRAERSGKLTGWEVRMGQDELGIFAETTIHRKDWSHPFRWRVYMQEAQKDTGVWKQSPLFMLRKVCISQAFRLCFPEEISALPYTEEEVGLNGEHEYVEKEEPKEVQIRMITEAQQKKIRVLLKELGIKERSEILELISNIVGRQVESSNELTLEEASHVIDSLEAELKARQEVSK